MVKKTNALSEGRIPFVQTNYVGIIDDSTRQSRQWSCWLYLAIVEKNLLTQNAAPFAIGNMTKSEERRVWGPKQLDHLQLETNYVRSYEIARHALTPVKIGSQRKYL